MSMAIPGGTLSVQWEPSEFQAPASEPLQSNAVFVEHEIADKNPESDRTAVFNSVLSSVGASGGGVVHYFGNHRILGDIVIPQNVALVGPVRSAGQLVHVGAGAADYESKPGVLRLASTATIRVGTSGYFGRAVVVRDGLNLPFAGLSEAVAGVAAFSGTAVTIAGNEARVEGALFLGFNRAIDSNGYQRLRFIDVQGDCTNGIRLAACTDVPYIHRCHFWPFTTANYTWTASDTTQRILTRSGIGFELKDTVDWGKLTNCFTYGYFRGFRLSNVNASLLTGCASDGPVSNGVPVVTGAIGALIEGGSLDTSIVGFTAAAASQGIFVGTSPGCFTELIGCNNVACTIGVNVRDGDVSIIGGLDRVAQIGVQVQSSVSRVSGNRSMRQVATPINAINPANVRLTVN